MSAPERMDLALGVLDHQLTDSNGWLCGKVDDLELDDSGERPRVTALVVGPGAWPGRLRGPLGRIAARLGGNRTVKVPWNEVGALESCIELKKPARELRLGGGDVRAARLIERLPGS